MTTKPKTKQEIRKRHALRKRLMAESKQYTTRALAKKYGLSLTKIVYIDETGRSREPDVIRDEIIEARRKYAELMEEASKHTLGKICQDYQMGEKTVLSIVRNGPPKKVADDKSLYRVPLFAVMKWSSNPQPGGCYY